MQLKSIVIGNKAINFTKLVNPGSDNPAAPEEEHKVTAHEAPLPELGAAFGKLRTIVCDIMAIPKDWAEGVAVTTMRISTTKHGTRAVQLGFKKPLETIGGQLHAMETPYVKIDKPADGESGEMSIPKKSADLIKAAIHQAERYAEGERSQTLLDFEKGKEALQLTADKGQDQLAL
jgi:hypothetical protein